MDSQAQDISNDDFFVTNQNIKIAYSISFSNDYVLKNKYIVLIHGSGRKTREYSYFKEIAVPNFALLGFSVITYDKRGCGMSSGKYEGLGVENSVNLVDKLSTDVEAIIEEIVKFNPEAKFGLFGVSQAGWIIPLIASRKVIDFTIIASGPIVSVGEEIFYSELTDSGKAIIEADLIIEQFKGKTGFDPLQYIKEMKCRAVWLFGENDISIPVQKSIRNFQHLINQDNIYLFSYKLFSNANHGLIDITSGERINVYSKHLNRWLKNQY